MQSEDPAEEAFFDESNETAVDDPADDAKQKFKIDVYNVVLDTIVTGLKTPSNKRNRSPDGRRAFSK